MANLEAVNRGPLDGGELVELLLDVKYKRERADRERLELHETMLDIGIAYVDTPIEAIKLQTLDDVVLDELSDRGIDLIAKVLQAQRSRDLLTDLEDETRERVLTRMGHSIVVASLYHTEARQPISKIVYDRSGPMAGKSIHEVEGNLVGFDLHSGHLTVKHEKKRGRKAGDYDVELIDPITNRPLARVSFPKTDESEIL